jgi:hypothetical protein
MATDTTEPGKAEVVAWMARHGGSAIEAARTFFPGISPEAQQKKAELYRLWWSRAKKAGQVNPTPASTPQGAQHRAPALARPAPRLDLARMSPLDRLEWQVSELGADLELARSVGDYRTALQIDQQLAERAAELDAVRARQARVLRLDRTAGSVAAELAKKSKAIELRAEMERRRAERAAKAAEQQSSKERSL